ncbi:MAG TPA: EthD family reductase, partial [Gemmatimonadales bacterium]|nr:EthD family reductase [Gemmatimonadales bacterium]
WVRRRSGMSADDFRRYWLTMHAPLARASLPGLKEYRINLVTGTLEGAPFMDGVAELYWDTRDAFVQDITSRAGRRVLDDLANFASEAGPLLAEEVPPTRPSGAPMNLPAAEDASDKHTGAR